MRIDGLETDTGGMPYVLLTPNDERVAKLKDEAAQRLVAHALSLKYEGRKKEAVEHARLALSFAPSSVEAQGLLRELEKDGGTAPSVSPSGSASAAAPERSGTP